MSSQQPQKLLKPGAAAEFLDRSPSTLAKQRMSGTGPRFIKLGASVRYDLRDLEEHVARCARRSTSEGARAVPDAPAPAPPMHRKGKKSLIDPIGASEVEVLG